MGSVAIPLAGQFSGTPGVYRQSFQADVYDNDRATAQTVAAMCRHIRWCAADPYIKWAAADALSTWGRPGSSVVPGDERSRAAWAVWWWVHSNCKFVQDDEQLLRLLNERDQLELLITPSVMMRLQPRQGDCDDFTMLTCCLLECLGVPWRIVTVAVDPDDTGRWSHVFAAIPTSAGLLALDASHGERPGWHIPVGRIHRLQVWTPEGSPSGEELRMSQSIRGLHGYRPNPALLRRRRGIGQDSGDGTVGSLSNVFTDIGLPADTNVGSSTTYNPPPILPSTPSASSGALTTALANEATALTRIFGQTLAPQTTIQSGPGGTLITGPSGAIAQTSLPSLSLSGGFNMSSLVLLGVIALGGLIFVKAISK